MKQKPFNLFVYGTLKTDSNPGRMFRALTVKDATAVGEMYNISDRYPGVVFGKAGTVKGQLILDIPPEMKDREYTEDWKFNTLSYLDKYEGVTSSPSLYRRVTVTVKTADGEVEAYAYEAAEGAMFYSKGVIASGDWKAFSQAPCPHMDKTKEGWDTCKLTGCSCPYAGDEHKDPMTGVCRLPAYANKHPEKDVPDAVLEPIAEFFSGCMSCDALTHHYYLSNCGACGGVYDQLRLRYLAKCYNDAHKKESNGK